MIRILFKLAEHDIALGMFKGLHWPARRYRGSMTSRDRLASSVF